jgi:hypothetical protein
MKLAIAFSFLATLASSECSNACSGNGICGANSKCSCHQNWQGADCSLRTCTFTLAWADTADGTNQAHYYAECGNKGTCDRKSGECKCFDGYEGKGCRRSTCPEGCSGHGTCEYIDELAQDYQDRRTGPGNKFKDLSCSSALQFPAKTTSCAIGNLVTSNTVSRQANTDISNGHLYQLWDSQKIQLCRCDLGYDGADCSHRISPKGDDPVTSIKMNMMKQAIQIGATAGTPTYANEQFSMLYHDPYGGVWRTDAIDATSDDNIISSRVQDALRDLPNEVLEGVKVTAQASDNPKICQRFDDGVQHLAGFETPHIGHHKDAKYTTNNCKYASTDGAAGAGVGQDGFGKEVFKMDFQIEFADKPGQTGVQYLFEVDLAARSAGSFPVSAGITTATSVATVAEINYNENLGNLSELAECADRGLDNGDGECECFDGYRGLACEELEALV